MDSQRGKKGRPPPKNAWNVPKNKPNTSSTSKATNHAAADANKSREREKAEAEQRFQAAKSKLEQSVQKHLSHEYDVSSSEEEEELESDNILGSLLKSYTSSSGGEKIDLGRTQRFLEDAFQSGAATCLICIASVKRADPIWSCEECYCFFHLPCIQRWAADCVAQQKRAAEDLAPYEKRPDLLWGCPKCRKDYQPSETPQHYACFCGQTKDPPFHLWLVPHSCGETCGKPLQPVCGHKCLLLCHPGPCPPCPQITKRTCHCSGSSPQPRRCSDQLWSCGAACKHLLGCGKHRCENMCHAGQCEPCPRTSKQHCMCHSKSREQSCSTPAWQCSKVCGAPLQCGHHCCEVTCHPPGQCGPCPLSGTRTCPCGKTTHPGLPCTREAPTCGDTCAKLLSCGVHKCEQRCHRDKCGSCLQVSVKKCRCGLHEKEMSCQKEFLCEVKCKRMRTCSRHPCNRKCCDGQCSPCEKVCGNKLGCSKHKCNAICHHGPCYPCPLTEDLACSCGDTKIIVPCGRKRQLKPPKCNKPCRIPPDCHHAKRNSHKCHAGECPACKQTCGLARKCGHSCVAPCHNAVWVTTVLNADKPLAGPWEKRESKREMKALPCPNCVVPMPVTCLGGHETAAWPCHKAKPSSCGRACGRSLACENHLCSLPCHTVRAASSPVVAGENCCTCEFSCTLARPEGCTHPCLSLCHPAPCKPCPQGIKLKCHCGLSQLHRPCAQWTRAQRQADVKEIEKLLSCGNQCAKNYECGHRCRALCHSGECPDPQQCQRKVKLTCTCKRIRKEFTCDVIKAKNIKVVCDDVCKSKLREEKSAREQEEDKRKREQERKDREELEKFEKWQQGKKKQRERKRRVSDTEEPSVWQKYGTTVVAVAGTALVLGFAYTLLSQ